MVEIFSSGTRNDILRQFKGERNQFSSVGHCTSSTGGSYLSLSPMSDATYSLTQKSAGVQKLITS